MKQRLTVAVMMLGLLVLSACSEKEFQSKTPEPDVKAVVAASPQEGPIRVEVVETDGQFTLLRDGQPYVIKGAGIDRPKEVDPDGADLAEFVAHGGNSFRNWRDQSDTDGLAILDAAWKHGLTVAMSIPVGRERKGFDYDDEAAVAEQFEYARNEVLAFRHHPALLMWIIGNEVNMHATNPKVYDAVNDIAKMIRELDPNHPVTTALSGFGTELADITETRMPDLDILSVQVYADVVNLPRRLAETNLTRPIIVSEWGTRGHWEVDQTEWGAPIEMNSSEKARHYLRAYHDAIAAVPGKIIGSYAFVWGQKQERTPTWYGLFLEDGSETESIDSLHYIWRGEWPDNRAPAIESMTLNGGQANDSVILAPGLPYPAVVEVSDPDGDKLSFRWELMYESEATQVGGDREEVPDTISGRILGGSEPSVTILAPEKTGAYRLYVYVYDGQGNAGHANIPFLVESA